MLSTSGMPCPTILKPDDYFTIRLSSGGADVTDLPWNPMVHKTLVVSKRRDTAASWRVSDTVRGNNLAWRCDVGGLEIASSLAFTANGVTVGADAEYQGSRVDYFWRASPKAGFDIVKIDHVSGAQTTVSHNVGGLVQYGWEVPLDGGDVLEFHHKLPTGKCLALNSSSAATAVEGGPITSTANTVTMPSNRASGRYILYLWRGVPQFSAFEAFDGTGNPDGPMLPLDFQARFTAQKRGDQYGNYYVHSTEQNPANPVDQELSFDLSDGEVTVPVREDILSNGIKIRMGNNANNVSGARITLAAWAQTPGKFARAR
jgi:hypothetical protein